MPSNNVAAPVQLPPLHSFESDRDKRYQARQAELQFDAQKRKNKEKQAYLEKLAQERQSSNAYDNRAKVDVQLNSSLPTGNIGLAGPLQPVMIPEREHPKSDSPVISLNNQQPHRDYHNNNAEEDAADNDINYEFIPEASSRRNSISVMAVHNDQFADRQTDHDGNMSNDTKNPLGSAANIPISSPLQGESTYQTQRNARYRSVLPGNPQSKQQNQKQNENQHLLLTTSGTDTSSELKDRNDAGAIGKEEQVGQSGRHRMIQSIGDNHLTQDQERKRKQLQYARDLEQQIKLRSQDNNNLDDRQTETMFGPNSPSDIELKMKKAEYARDLEHQMNQNPRKIDPEQTDDSGLFGRKSFSQELDKMKKLEYGRALQEQMKQKQVSKQIDWTESPRFMSRPDLNSEERLRKMQYGRELQEQIRQKKSERNDPIESDLARYGFNGRQRLNRVQSPEGFPENSDTSMRISDAGNHSSLNIGERSDISSRMKKIEYARALQAQMQERAASKLRQIHGDRIEFSVFQQQKQLGEDPQVFPRSEFGQIRSVSQDSALTGLGERERQNHENLKQQYAKQLQIQIEEQKHRKRLQNEEFLMPNPLTIPHQPNQSQRRTLDQEYLTPEGRQDSSKFMMPHTDPDSLQLARLHQESNSDSLSAEHMKKKEKAEKYRLDLQKQVEEKERKKQLERQKEQEEEEFLRRKIEKENEEMERQSALEKEREQAQKKRALERAALTESGDMQVKSKVKNYELEQERKRPRSILEDKPENATELSSRLTSDKSASHFVKRTEHQDEPIASQTIDGQRIMDELKMITNQILHRQMALQQHLSSGLESLLQKKENVQALEQDNVEHLLENAPVDESIAARTDWVPASHNGAEREPSTDVGPKSITRASMHSFSELIYDHPIDSQDMLSSSESLSDSDEVFVHGEFENCQSNDNVVPIDAKPSSCTKELVSRVHNIEVIFAKNQIRLEVLQACKGRSTLEQITAYLATLDGFDKNAYTKNDEDIDNQSMFADTRWLASDLRYR